MPTPKRRRRGRPSPCRKRRSLPPRGPVGGREGRGGEGPPGTRAPGLPRQNKTSHPWLNCLWHVERFPSHPYGTRVCLGHGLDRDSTGTRQALDRPSGIPPPGTIPPTSHQPRQDSAPPASGPVARMTQSRLLGLFRARPAHLCQRQATWSRFPFVPKLYIAGPVSPSKCLPIPPVGHHALIEYNTTTSHHLHTTHRLIS